jgi:GNAT superfamily N-acetyltransferase
VIPARRSGRSLAVVVRRAETADAAAIAAIQVRSWHAAYRGVVPDDVLKRFTVAGRTERWVELLEQGSETYVVEGGFCSVIRPARDASAPAELAALYVDRARWRAGVGSALVAAALSSREPVSLWVFAANVRARSFYRAQGFVEDGAEAVDPDTGVLELRMWRAAET